MRQAPSWAPTQRPTPPTTLRRTVPHSVTPTQVLGCVLACPTPRTRAPHLFTNTRPPTNHPVGALPRGRPPNAIRHPPPSGGPSLTAFPTTGPSMRRRVPVSRHAHTPPLHQYTPAHQSSRRGAPSWAPTQRPTESRTPSYRPRLLSRHTRRPLTRQYAPAHQSSRRGAPSWAPAQRPTESRTPSYRRRPISRWAEAIPHPITPGTRRKIWHPPVQRSNRQTLNPRPKPTASLQVGDLNSTGSADV